MAEKEKAPAAGEPAEEKKTAAAEPEAAPGEEAAQAEAAAPEAKTSPEKEPDEAQKTEQELETLQKQLAQTADVLLRTRAEFDNFRKRTQKEREALYRDVKIETVAKFLPVLDNFERAMDAESDADTLRRGIEMILKQMRDITADLGVETFGERGDAFDPNLHNGVMHEEDESLGENVVSEVLQKGYRLGDRLIRPATVKVAN